MRPELQTLICFECGGPWGVLKIGKEARAMLIANAQDHWNPVDLDGFISEAHVVYITGAQARFAAERFGSEVLADDCWQNAAHVDAPMWWLHSRRRRQATLIDCCRVSDLVGPR